MRMNKSTHKSAHKSVHTTHKNCKKQKPACIADGFLQRKGLKKFLQELIKKHVKFALSKFYKVHKVRGVRENQSFLGGTKPTVPFS